MARSLGRRLIGSFKDRAVGWGGMRTPFQPFMACLFCLWQGQSWQSILPAEVSLGPYQRIIDAWNGSGQELTEALASACDYHTRRCDHSGGEDGEFYHTLYDVFPAEILAIMRVRELLGLRSPTVDHPLMQTPLAKPQSPYDPANDKVLQVVLAKARSFWPDITDL
jgi:hypothetical protein